MNNLKRFFALILCLALMVCCFAGCHEKGEIAVTIGDVQFTSGDYACALLFADMEARDKVNTTLNATALTGAVNYTAQTIDGKSYTAWVEARALENLRSIAAVKTLCAEKKIVSAGEFKDIFDSTIENLWADASFVSLMEENGIAKETFKDYAYYSYILDNNFFDVLVGEQSNYNLGFEHRNPLFDGIYGKNGEKAVSSEQINNWLSTNCLLVNRLTVSFDALKEEEITKKNEKFNEYLAALKDGTKTFEEIYIEDSGLNAEDHKHEEPAEGELAAKDPHAVLISKEATEISYASEYYDAVKEMANGEAKIIELEDKKGLVLVVKKDLAEDPYYAEFYDYWIRLEIVGDELANTITAKTSALPAHNVNSKSTKQFKVEDIFYPEYTETTTTY